MSTIHTRIANRRASRTRARSFRRAVNWAGMVAASIVALPAAGLVGWLLAASLA